MNHRLGDLRSKEVIDMTNGKRIGFIGDIELNTATGAVAAIVIYGRLRGLGLFGRDEELVIPWQQITLFGDDTVLVRPNPQDALRHGTKKQQKMDRFCF